MKILYFNDELNNETVQDLIEKIEENPDASLYFTSTGGNHSAVAPLLDAMWQNNICLYGNDCLISGGMFVFAKYSGTKFLINDCYGMLHARYFELDKKDKKEKAFYQFAKYDCKTDFIQEVLELGEKLELNEDEMLRLANGEDVYFTPSRMKEIFD